MGGNLGFLGDRDHAKKVLDVLHDITTDNALILGASRDLTTSSDPETKQRVARNLEAGRFSGQGRIRIRYRKHATPFFDFIRYAPVELEELLEGTGWNVSEILRQDDSDDRSDAVHSLYVALIDKA